MTGIVTQGMGGVKLATQGYGTALPTAPLKTTLNVATVGVRGDSLVTTGNMETTTAGGGAG